MDAFESKPKSDNGGNGPVEVRLRAQSVSRGVAIGKIVCLHGRKRQFYRIDLRDSQIDREVRRFQAAIRLAGRQIKSLQFGAGKKIPDSAASIVDVHRMMLEDASLQSKIEKTIREDRVNAEWALKVVIDGYVAKFKAIPDEQLRSRYIDMDDVAERLLTALGGGSRSNIRLEKNSIVVAKEINPSTLIELGDSNPKGLITEHGGWTSHTFILAREVNMPAVTGIRRLMRRVQTGDSVIVDGYSGQIILNPAKETLRAYRSSVDQFHRSATADIKTDGGATKTLDGREIIIRANVDFPSAYRAAKRFGAKGIGLYRSEFLFNQFRGFPTEAEQIDSYRKIAALAGEDGVKIRTFDISSEQLTDQSFEKEKNPALGLRAIRLSLTYQRQFRVQLRSILIASAGQKIDIVLPMISDVSEIRQTKQLIDQEREFLRKKGTKIGTPQLGVMIEVPSAVLTVKEIAAEADFLCLGTNDLVQYLLAVDRDNESVADWFQTLHPAIVEAVRRTLEAGSNMGIPVVVCGEMAGSPFYTPLLVGLGATELSMNVNSIRQVRKVISGIAYEEAVQIVKEIDRYATAGETETALFDSMRSKWKHLFPAEMFLRTNRAGR